MGQRSKSITSILTPGYAPLEQYDTKAEDVGPWSDLYALGMVAYRCVSGLRDADLPDAVTRSRNQRKGVPDLTPAVEVGQGNYDVRFLQAIDWAIQVNEEERPQTLTAWRGTLSDSDDLDEAGWETEEELEEKKGAGRWVLALAGVTALGIGLWLMWPHVERLGKPVLTGQSEPTVEAVKSEQEPVTPAPVAQVEPPEEEVEKQTTGDATAEWNRAQQIDTPDAYRQFLSRYPNSPLTTLAGMKLADIEGGSRPASEAQPEPTGNAMAEWNRAQQINTPAAYRQFLGRYPSGPLAKLAEGKLAEME